MVVPPSRAGTSHARATCAHSSPPLHGDWDPRLGLGTLPGAAARRCSAGGTAVDAGRAAAVARACCSSSYAGGLAWMLALAFVDGPSGHLAGARRTATSTSAPPARSTDVRAARRVTSTGSRSAARTTGRPTSAGHPPGALLFFVGAGPDRARRRLRRRARGHARRGDAPRSRCWSTLRALGAEEAARRAAPFLVLGPAAVFMAVSGRRRRSPRSPRGAWPRWRSPRPPTATAAAGRWSVRRRAAARLLRDAVLRPAAARRCSPSRCWPLRAVVAAAARSAAVAALAVVLAFAGVGFAWWEALPGAAATATGTASPRDRPAAYWIWGNLAALLALRRPAARRRARRARARVAAGRPGRCVLLVAARPSRRGRSPTCPG